jgi:hypothetical protein
MDRSTHQVGSCGQQDHLDATNRQHTPLCSLFVAPLVMDTSNCVFPVAAEVLRLQKAAARNPDLKEVPPTKRGTNGLLVNDNARRIYKEFVVQMENGMATEQAQQECISIDDDDDESKPTNDGKKQLPSIANILVTLAPFNKTLWMLRIVMMIALMLYWMRIVRVRIFNTVYINSYQVQSKGHGI